MKRTAKPKPVPAITPATKLVIADLSTFTPCRQCGNPGDCTRANRCVKGFK